MALPYTAGFNKFVLKVGNGASPEVFSAPCGLMSRGFNRTVKTGETDVPDCSDESLPAITMREVVAKSAEITGSGVLSGGTLATWEDALGVEKNYQVVLDLPLAQGGGSWTLPMILTTFNITSTKGEKVKADITLTSSGAIADFDPADA